MLSITQNFLRSATLHRNFAMVGAILVLVLSTLTPMSFTQSDRIIQTYAGTGVCGLSGDGGTATGAQLRGPAGLATDLAGNLYISDLGNHVVRKVTPFGTITTVAGTGSAGYNGDNKLSTNAQLAAPSGVAVDQLGRNLYIADNGNHVIRRVDMETLTITTVAGIPGQPGFEGDGGLATLAKLNYPSSIVVDSMDNLYIADSQNKRVRRVDTDGIITTVAGSGARGSDGDDGPATQASFRGLTDLALGPTGDLFIADGEAHRVRRVDASGIITTYAGNGTFFPPTAGPATDSSIRWPQGLTIGSDGSLYISDNASHMVFRVNPEGMLSVVTGTGAGGFGGDDGPANLATLNGPSGLSMDHFGNLFISDSLNCRVRIISAQ